MPQPLFKYQIIYKTIVRHNSETIVNFEPTSNCQYHHSWSVRNFQGTFQQGVDIFRKTKWKSRWDDSLKILQYGDVVSKSEYKLSYELDTRERLVYYYQDVEN